MSLLKISSLITPMTLYQQALETGEYQPDEVQYQTVATLTEIQQALSQRAFEASHSVSRRWQKGFFWWKKAPPKVLPISGLYMWGGVGRGKTWLMDLFYRSVPGERKLRLHFHRVMLRVHEELAQYQGHENPLEKVADGFKAQAEVLCFDEFFVTDITDAMLLGTLLQALFSRGVTLVVTSNIPPDHLYENGLQRARFLPVIALLKQYCQVVNVDAGVDYRLRTLTQTALYLTPLSDKTAQRLHEMFFKLAGKEGKLAQILQINQRPLPVIEESEGIVAIAFSVLCEEARSHRDYIALSQVYHTVFLHNVTSMGEAEEDSARRFLALVDEFYERRVKLIISATLPMHDLYQGRMLKFEYQRCLSRLQEMQSEVYLRLPHLP